MELTTIDILSILIAFEATLFALYVLSLKSEQRISNVFIAFYILLFGLESVNILFYEHFFFNHPQYALILDPLFYLELPLVYLYIKSASFKDFKITRYDSLHLIPFVIAHTLIVFGYHTKTPEVKILLISSSAGADELFLRLLYLLLIIQAVIYTLLSLKEVNRYKQIVFENYSDISKNNYKWIRQLILAFIFIFVVASVKNISIYLLPGNVHDTLFIVLKIIVLAFISWVIYKALRRPYLFQGVDSQISLIKELIKEKERVGRKSNEKELSPEEKTQLGLLESFMVNKKPYLDPALSLHDLAGRLNIPTRELSVLINKSFGKHYFDFINGYRIDHAVEILTNPPDEKITMLEIMYEVGFNSKSSFNTAFKKHTTFTPSAYKQKLSQSTH